MQRCSGRQSAEEDTSCFPTKSQLNNQSAQRTLETMSGVRGFVPAAVAAAVGVLTGKFAPLRIAHCRITSHPSVRIEFKS